MNIHNFLFLKIICCLKNIYINKIAVGNPVVASKNIIELLLPLSVTSILESTPKKELIAFNVFEKYNILDEYFETEINLIQLRSMDDQQL